MINAKLLYLLPSRHKKLPTYSHIIANQKSSLKLQRKKKSDKKSLIRHNRIRKCELPKQNMFHHR